MRGAVGLCHVAVIIAVSPKRSLNMLPNFLLVRRMGPSYTYVALRRLALARSHFARMFLSVTLHSRLCLRERRRRAMHTMNPFAD
jgi:hypothetical protein